VDRSNERGGEAPLVPNSVGIHTPPDMHRDRLAGPDRDGGGERNEEREPAEHSFGVRLQDGGEGREDEGRRGREADMRSNGDRHVIEENGVEGPAEAVDALVLGGDEAQGGVSSGIRAGRKAGEERDLVLSMGLSRFG
jgi:hypothetical protein